MPVKISTRLAFGYSTTIALGLALSLYSAVTMNGLTRSVDELATDRMVKVARLTTLMDNFNNIARSARTILIVDDPKFYAEEKAKIVLWRQENSALLSKLDASMKRPDARALLKTLVDNRGPYNAALDRTMALAVAGDKAKAAEMLASEVAPLQAVVFKATGDVRSLQQRVAEEVAIAARESASFALTVMAYLALAMVAFGSIVAWRVIGTLKRALGAEPAELSATAARVADGDLSRPLTVLAGDKTSVLATLARMQTALNQVVGTVRSGADSVATASAEIAQGNSDLSQRTEQQASSLEETAASMEQLGATVRANSEHAVQANQLAQTASDVATRGGSAVQDVVETMKGISESSGRIADIIGTIDGIAFQTNILALNAAVEAARAGEQGRGFAVVASEVRTLAQRSAEAAKQIKVLITQSAERVEHGARQVGQAGATMEEVVRSIRRVTDIMGEISSASREQTAGISQVGEAVTAMDQSTQQNAALVEESAAAAESLKTQAQQLVAAVAVFKLQQAGGERSSTTASISTPGPAAHALAKAAISKAGRSTTSTSPSSQRRPSAPPTLRSSAPRTVASAADDWESF